jgi:hypothetical protein
MVVNWRWDGWKDETRGIAEEKRRKRGGEVRKQDEERGRGEGGWGGDGGELEMSWVKWMREEKEERRRLRGRGQSMRRQKIWRTDGEGEEEKKRWGGARRRDGGEDRRKEEERRRRRLKEKKERGNGEGGVKGRRK